MLIILTALHCEATPIVSKFKLKKKTEISAFQIYQKDQIFLVVSGIGKVATASALGFMHAWTNCNTNCAWLNIGIAGHSHLDLGEGFLANKIIERATEQSYFPPQTFNSLCLTDCLHTVEKPDGEYLKAGGVDMEAAAFYATASRFSTGELVQCYKVVSDNKSSPVRTFSKQEASVLIEKKLETICLLTEQLITMSDELNQLNKTHDFFNTIKLKIKLSHSEQLQVKERLNKINLLSNNSLLSDIDYSPSSKKFILQLDQLISSQKINF